MSMKLSGVYISEKDIDLFRYLHAVKVATYEQIHRDVFTDISLGAAGNRIRKLEDIKLIEVGRNRVIVDGKRYVSLRKNTFEQFVRRGGELQLELKSDAIQHDLTLVDIRHLLMKSARFLGYQTENELQTWSIKYKHLNSDALATFRLGTEAFAIPVEYESSLKKADRYEPFVKKYYRAEDLPLVALVADSQDIIDTIIESERKLFNWEKPKFFYKLKQKLFEDESLSFENCNQAVLSLGDG